MVVTSEVQMAMEGQVAVTEALVEITLEGHRVTEGQVKITSEGKAVMEAQVEITSEGKAVMEAQEKITSEGKAVTEDHREDLREPLQMADAETGPTTKAVPTIV